MVVVDTNLLIRLATGDVTADRDAVARLIEKHEIRIPKTVLLETEWVLRSRYSYSSAQVLAFFEHLAGWRLCVGEQFYTCDKVLQRKTKRLKAASVRLLR